ncbi:MAG TPA: ADOP family duplicated permease, partial [Gemmatimonadaceae bacterium]|nr:ADOP family duplicated permease [Gemmatimonadaceae bacterium]
RPALGRFFSPEEDSTPGAHPVIVLSDRAWRTSFGADPSVVGRTVWLNGSPFVVIGVAPRGFTSTFAFFSPDFYAPIMSQPQIHPQVDISSRRRSQWLKMTARLRPGVAPAEAQAALRTVNRQLTAAYPPEPDTDEYKRGQAHEEIELSPVGSLPRDARAGAAGLIAFVAAVVGLVLMIASSNVAAMLLARAAARRREFAVRRSLGAGRGRVVRLLLTESLLLFALAGGAGTLFALWMRDSILGFRPPISLPVELEFGIDARALGFALFVSLATGFVFGLAPALQATRRDVGTVLREGGLGSTTDRHRARAGGRFVIAQMAMSLLMLVVAGLFVRGLERGRAIYPGTDPDRVQLIELNLSQQGYSNERRQEFYRQVIERLAAVPGVAAVSLAKDVPVGPGYSSTRMILPDGRPVYTEGNVITPRYFETLGIRLLRGRDFGDADAPNAPQAAIVNEAFARYAWPGRDPIGQRFTDGGTVTMTVVGVVENSGRRETVTGHGRFLYLPLRQRKDWIPDMTLHARVPGDPQPVLAAIRREIGAIAPTLPLDRSLSLSDLLGVTLLPQRIAAAVAGTFGALALALAALGIYGVVAYAVTERTREIGVRVALGAMRRDVLRMVLGQGLRLATIGVTIGLTLAMAAAGALRSLLFGLSAYDSLTLAGASLTLVAVALLATLVPARRAAKVDPMVALRSE